MTFGSLFSGIGGIDLGLERAGMECRWQVEINEFCQRILEKHWPRVKKYADIRKLTGEELEPVDLIAGGFPCQDLSLAAGSGNPLGIDGSRSGLWFEFARLVRRLEPRYVFIENVPGLLVYDAMRRVVGELARLRYVGSWISLRASDFSASHLRKRVFIVAHTAKYGTLRKNDRGISSQSVAFPTNASDCLPIFAPGPNDAQWSNILRERPDLAPALDNPNSRKRLRNKSCAGGRIKFNDGCHTEQSREKAESKVCGMADGLPNWVDRAMSNRTDRLKALGNAVVPQCAEWVGRKILKVEAAMDAAAASEGAHERM